MAKQLSANARTMFDEIGPSDGGFYMLTGHDYEEFEAKFGWTQLLTDAIFQELIDTGYAEQLPHYWLFDPTVTGDETNG